MRFTDAQIKALKPKAQRYDVREGQRNGFGIRVATSGRKTWFFIYDFEGDRRRMNLGIYPQIDLKTAREKHGDALKLLRHGKDPAGQAQAEKQERRKAPTVKDLIDDYLERWAKPRKLSWREDERILMKDVDSRWRRRKAADITRRDIIDMLEDIAERGPVQANRTLAVVRKMFNFAVERDILSVSPCLQVKPPAREVSKQRNLDFKEVKIFWDSLPNAPMTEGTRRILQLILVLAQRPGEVAGMDGREIDGEWWTIPAERTKGKREHRVYLSPLARELIGDPEPGPVFPSPRGKIGEDGKREEVPMHVNALSHAIRDAMEAKDESGEPTMNLESFTPHDLRRTAVTRMAEMGVSQFHIDRILNHSQGRLQGTYNKYDWDREKKESLEKWGRKIEFLTRGGKTPKVVNFQR